MKPLAAGCLVLLAASCSAPSGPTPSARGFEGNVKLVTLDPGHFHAALVQKIMVPGVSSLVYVYGPEGPDLRDHLNRIEGFNTRANKLTRWREAVYAGPDFLEKMIGERKGNVVVISGNNKKKAGYIKAAVEAGLNVLADKPMALNEADFETLREAFASAARTNVLLYDIMTERSEITTIIQKELIANPSVFGRMEPGSAGEPAVVKSSVHHFFKTVAGSPLIRPAWFFDVGQQGEGIVDVTSHLVDLVQWECFPDRIIDWRSDIELTAAKRWTTSITRDQFRQATGLQDFSRDLQKDAVDGKLDVFCNGQIDYKIRGIQARVSVTWNFEAPEGGGDTHYSIIRGTLSQIVIRQDKDQKYRPELYVEAAAGTDRDDLGARLSQAMAFLKRKYPGLNLERENNRWHVAIPDFYRVGHEAHFGQVMERFLQYLKDGRLPEWEVPNMIAKYFVTTKALSLAKK